MPESNGFGKWKLVSLVGGGLMVLSGLTAKVWGTFLYPVVFRDCVTERAELHHEVVHIKAALELVRQAMKEDDEGEKLELLARASAMLEVATVPRRDAH